MNIHKGVSGSRGSFQQVLAFVKRCTKSSDFGSGEKSKRAVPVARTEA